MSEIAVVLPQVNAAAMKNGTRRSRFYSQWQQLFFGCWFLRCRFFAAGFFTAAAFFTGAFFSSAALSSAAAALPFAGALACALQTRS
jgi:hypothetical protein